MTVNNKKRFPSKSTSFIKAAKKRWYIFLKILLNIWLLIYFIFISIKNYNKDINIILLLSRYSKNIFVRVKWKYKNLTNCKLNTKCVGLFIKAYIWKSVDKDLHHRFAISLTGVSATLILSECIWQGWFFCKKRVSRVHLKFREKRMESNLQVVQWQDGCCYE